jgi:hypothetical protein
MKVRDFKNVNGMGVYLCVCVCGGSVAVMHFFGGGEVSLVNPSRKRKWTGYDEDDEDDEGQV